MIILDQFNKGNLIDLNQFKKYMHAFKNLIKYKRNKN